MPRPNVCSAAPQVDLFGRPLTDFLDLRDQAMVEEVTSQFNHYETFYDAARVTLVDSRENRRQALLIISLNFDAGNPVNFQIIMNAEPITEDDAPERLEPAEEFFSRLFDRSSLAVDRGLADTVREYLRADLVQLFRTEDTPWKLITQSPQDCPIDIDSAATSETEFIGFAGDRMVLRAAFVSHPRPADAMAADRRTQLIGLGLTRLLSQPAGPGLSTGFSLSSTHSAVELLGLQSIGAALIGADGKLADINSAMTRILGSDLAGRDVMRLAESLKGAGEADVEAAVLNYVETASQADYAPSLGLPVVTGNGRAAELALVRLAPGTNDLSGFVVLNELKSRDGRPAPNVSEEFLSCVLAQVQSSLSAARGVWEKLLHEHHGALGRDGDFYLKCLNNQLLRIASSISGLARLKELAHTDYEAQQTDLNLIIDQAAEDMARAESAGNVSVLRDDLPKAILPRQRLNMTVRTVMRHLIRQAAGTPVKIRASATTGEAGYSLKFCREGVAVDNDELSRWLEYRPEPGEPLADLASARELARSCGGGLGLRQDQEAGLICELRFPLYRRQ